MDKYYIKAVGVTFDNRQRTIAKLKVGDELKFLMEPTNPYDNYAIQIVTLDGKQIGYASNEYNQEIFKKLKNGKKYKLIVLNITGGGFDSNYGVNILVEEDI